LCSDGMLTLSTFRDTMCWLEGWNLQSSHFKEFGFQYLGNFCPQYGKIQVNLES
jgi:hypothetical protein